MLERSPFNSFLVLFTKSNWLFIPIYEFINVLLGDSFYKLTRINGHNLAHTKHNIHRIIANNEAF